MVRQPQNFDEYSQAVDYCKSQAIQDGRPLDNFLCGHMPFVSLYFTILGLMAFACMIKYLRKKS